MQWLKVPRIAYSIAILSILISCSTPQKRAEQYPQAFAALANEDQQLVLQGEIREGFTEEAVIIALGRPDKINKGRKEGKDEIHWIYTKLYMEALPSHRYVGHTHGDRVVLHSFYDPEIITTQIDEFEVTFRGGKVIGWREL